MKEIFPNININSLISSDEIFSYINNIQVVILTDKYYEK